ncbi:MAG TPA: carboxypeptidase-like regulatory domain-containing protein [Pyrinomonadaceae bacterium]|nr:carboxypeptidase-like regulatory domain-containing protein [Pyrinomonadaceae bacterium]
MKTLCTLVLIISGVVTALAQSQPAAKSTASPSPTTSEKRAPTENPPATGSIKGRVVADDGRPVVNAMLMAQAINGQPSARPAQVDAEGKFSFDELPLAAYVVFAMAPGYIDEAMSTGDPNDWPRHLIGSQLKIKMIKGGVITGKVTNSKGDPIVGVPVHAMSLNDPVWSPTDFLGGGGAESDDRGIYRIYGLRPGPYVVSAGGPGQFGFARSNGFDLDVPTYYPAATRDTAIPVVVRSGDETAGIDIKYVGGEGHRVSGFVVGGINAGASAASGAIVIFLSHAGTQSVLSMALSSPIDQSRAFGFNGVADGEYDLFATFQTGQQTDALLVATKRVTVRGGDVTGVELTLAPLASIAGAIMLDPIKPEDKCDERGSQLIETIFAARRDDPRKSGSQMMTRMLAGLGGISNAKGEFIARNLDAGRYRFEIKLPTDAWYVRVINVPAAVAAPPANVAKPNQSSPWQGTVTIKSGQQLGGVSIMVGQDAAGLRGRVTATPEGAALPTDLRVHLVPADREQANDVLRYSETTITSDGSFAFSNIAPGRYLIIARVEPSAETTGGSPRSSAWDPATRAKLRQDAEAVKVVVDLKPCERLKDYTLPLKLEQ